MFPKTVYALKGPGGLEPKGNNIRKTRKSTEAPWATTECKRMSISDRPQTCMSDLTPFACILAIRMPSEKLLHIYSFLNGHKINLRRPRTCPGPPKKLHKRAKLAPCPKLP